MINYLRVVTGFIAAFMFIAPSVYANVNGHIRFADDQYEIEVGQTTNLDIVADPQGNRIVGIDIMFSFDPKKIEIVGISKTDIFSELLGLRIDNLTGRARFSVVNSRGKYLEQQANIAVVSARLKESGESEISFEFEPGKTQDTNMVSHESQDVLASATGTSLTTFPTIGTDSTRAQASQVGIVDQQILGMQDDKQPNVITERKPVDRSFWLLVALAAGLVACAGLLFLIVVYKREQQIHQYNTY